MKTIKTIRALFQITLSSLAVVGFGYVLSASAGDKAGLSTTKTTDLNIVNIGSKGHFSNKNLQLQVSIPQDLKIANEQVNWVISRNGRMVKKLQGRTQSLNLPEGMYAVKLSIGKFSTSKEVSVLKGKRIQPYFHAAIARLQLSSNQVVDWLLVGSKQHKFTISHKSQFDTVLPADDYLVKAVLRDIPLHKEVRLKPGQTVKNAVNIPVGKVRLFAIKNNQPLFKPMLWKVYRLDHNRRQQVGKYRLHAKSISVPPGHYEAVAEHEDIRRTRQFWVRKDTTNKIILAMD